MPVDTDILWHVIQLPAGHGNSQRWPLSTGGGPARSTGMGYVCLAACIHLPEKRRRHHVRRSRRKSSAPDRE